MKKAYDELLEENKVLQSKIEALTKFINKEITWASFRLKRDEKIRQSRKKFDNLFETDILFSLREYFQGNFPWINHLILDRLIDAELLWMFMQKYSHLDGMAVAILYQKILDEWIENVIISWWRNSVKLSLYTGENFLEKDLFRVVSEKHTLSIGRFYAILWCFQSDSDEKGLIFSLNSYLQKNLPHIYQIVCSNIFFENLEKLIHMEVFWKKRHSSKISYIEIKTLRKILLEKPDGLFYKILAHEKNKI